jgi:hypothetical protein
MSKLLPRPPDSNVAPRSMIGRPESTPCAAVISEHTWLLSSCRLPSVSAFHHGARQSCLAVGAYLARNIPFWIAALGPSGNLESRDGTAVIQIEVREVEVPSPSMLAGSMSPGRAADVPRPVATDLARRSLASKPPRIVRITPLFSPSSLIQ